MKRICYLVLCGVLMFVIAACSNSTTPNATETAVSSKDSASLNEETVSSEATIQTEPIKFTDAAFEIKVHKALNKSEGDITLEEAKAVKNLDLSNKNFDDMNNSNEMNIKDISDIKYFTGLVELNISFNDIKDLTPLAGLTNVETLIFSGISAKDISPLKNFVNMKCIVFCWNNGNAGIPGGIENLDVLANMKNLEHIDAKNAGIKDISVLAGLTKLWDVQLCDNQIMDVTPLSNLKLKILLLANNPVKDFNPLKENYINLDNPDFEIK